jgi:hypothetical protein
MCPKQFSGSLFGKKILASLKALKDLDKKMGGASPKKSASIMKKMRQVVRGVDLTVAKMSGRR